MQRIEDEEVEGQRVEEEYNVDVDVEDAKAFLEEMRNGVASCRFSCDRCDFSTRLFSEIRSHLSTIHAAKRKAESPEVVDEKRQRLDTDDFSCKECDNVYQSNDSLRRHIRNKHTENSDEEIVAIFECGECDKSYNSKDSLRRHQRQQHPEVLVQTPKIPDEKNNANYKCDECDKNFELRSSLVRHNRTKHPKDEGDAADSSDEIELKGEETLSVTLTVENADEASQGS